LQQNSFFKLSKTKTRLCFIKASQDTNAAISQAKCSNRSHWVGYQGPPIQKQGKNPCQVCFI